MKLTRTESRRTPTLCVDRRGYSYAKFNGKQVRFGPAADPKSRTEFDEFLAGWLANGRTCSEAQEPPPPLTIRALIERFLEWARAYYRNADGTTSTEVVSIDYATKPLKEHDGDRAAAEFGPKALVAYRQRLIDKGHTRRIVNQEVSRVRRLFRWATSEELVPTSVYHGLIAVEGIRRGRSGVPEGAGVKPVPQEHIDKALPFMPAPVAAMVQVQLMTGCRPCEVVRMRVGEIDRSGPVWLYSPTVHKGTWRGHERTIAIGPRAQQVLASVLRPLPADAFVFDPSRAEQERMAARSARRKSKRWDSHVARQDRLRAQRERRVLNNHYSTVSYGRAIARACKLAKVAHWSPLRLRHNAATEFRRRYGLEVAGALLGHRLLETSQVYAEVDRAKAVEVMREIG